ncbi:RETINOBLASTOMA-BINDING PROTEIN 6 [Salix koriyanagi]|uniref:RETINOBLASTOMA-BINDING PROTEIN 6 n=1 Tax=Salix koriyanagi TaxID=2511006 RepID=A0A9Q0W0C0_9ROSI|nr:RETINOBLASTOMA-BINDING PROTEIN 6 [Salix koriyanagi]
MGVIDEEENRKILELVNTPALDMLGQGCDSGGSYVKGGKNGRTRGGRPNKTPPEGYLCHRCHVGGHFIQHCPTNGDPNYDVKRVKAATGIPKSMLKADPEGRCVLFNGEVAAMKPNEDVFEKEMEGIPARISSWDHLINSRLNCECGATDMLTDYLIPNMTVRRAINRILECDTSSGGGGGGSGSRTTSFQVQDLGSFLHCPSQTSKVSSTKMSATSPCSSSKEQQEPNDRVNPLPPMAKRARIAESDGESKTTIAPMNVKNLHGIDEEVDQKKLVSNENGKKRKRKRNASDQNLKTCENYMMMMPTGNGAYNPYWNGMGGGMEGSYLEPYYTNSMGHYGYSHFGMPYGNNMPQDFWFTMNREQAGEEALDSRFPC